MSAERDEKLAEALDYLRMPEVTKAKYAVVPVQGDRQAVAIIEGVIADMRADRARLLIAFHDAIRRPLGVTPDSGAEFYDPRMADEAEGRRRLKQAGGRHAYRPHKLYPHFCAQCGYAQREALMHLPADDAGLNERGGGSAA
ncbi:hypothetical protein MMSR116_11015 [Methylobacterium mesophilicum SR1.6/6]|uniref:Uncharacterized protein n=1 Tax=Methylobacterium mesophilicum SR1.6/6 TaxID=908290 RepID=A0A6B9FMM3_9HYPH|nr:hypothetical protein [Methylobacterium mesophilicum]QGY02345.1 hypothetical protein MMSR116_11015 [Methylobacterium mesophilicum SR1.6/6]